MSQTTTKDRHRVKVVEAEQRTVGHQAPQEPRPRKPPDKSNDASHHLVPWKRRLHRGDDHVELMYVSTWSQDRAGGAAHRGNECHQTFVHEQKDALDVLTSSSDPQALMVINERDSELIHPIRRGMCSGNPRHSDGLDAIASSPRKTRSTYGPQLAVLSSCQRFPTELCCCPLEAAEPGQSSNAHRPGTKSVST
jgi:hypothetical protein